MKDFFEFKWKFILYRLLSVFKKTTKTDKFLFVCQTGAKEWILGAKARRLSKFFTGESEEFYSHKFKSIPKAQGYFFLHQKYFAKALRYNPFLRKAKVFVMFTHPEWNKYYSKKQAKYTLGFASKIICLNKKMADDLVEIGIAREKLEVFHLASNPEFFSARTVSKTNTVGFCCYYYERKNPELVFKLIKQMPDVNFILVGQNWENYPKYDELMSFPNFKYYNKVEYEDYPGLYQKMDVFVSPSYLEGGPVPLLEAMLSNVVPVASDTGFCPDLIEHGKNGFLFDPYRNSSEEVEGMVRKAFEIEYNVREDVVKHSWVEYGKKIYSLFIKLN